jgi:hypothetical protein
MSPFEALYGRPCRTPPPPATGSPSLARILAERCHRPPFPDELLPKPPILTISCNFLTPLHLPSCRTSSHLTTTTGAPSPQASTIDPSFRCVPALSSLPGTFPVTPSRSPATPCRRRATACIDVPHALHWYSWLIHASL